MIVLDFKTWQRERAATFAAEDQIRSDKLAQGIDGLEWLVLNTEVTPVKRESTYQWISYLRERGFIDVHRVMVDAVVLNENSFYEKYVFNWWVSIDDTITCLALLRKSDYDTYFNLLQRIQNTLNEKGA